MSLPDPVDNPFTLVYDALWEIAENNSDLTQWVATNNRGKYDNWIGLKEVISSADLPELVLLTEGGEANLFSSSSESSITRYYSWAISTGDFNINGVYNQVCWELFRAMTGYCSVLSTLVWNDEYFVTGANLTTLKEGTLFTDQNRNIRGWASLWTTEVHMVFHTSELIPSD